MAEPSVYNLKFCDLLGDLFVRLFVSWGRGLFCVLKRSSQDGAQPQSKVQSRVGQKLAGKKLTAQILARQKLTKQKLTEQELLRTKSSLQTFSVQSHLRQDDQQTQMERYRQTDS